MWLVDHRLATRLFQTILALLVTVVSGVIAVWLAVRDNVLRRDAALPDQTRRQEFGAGEGWLVDLIVLQGAAPTGSDRGMLWIEGDRLLFAGDRTSFALAGNDVAGHIRTEEPIGGLRHALCVPLTHRTAAGPLALSFEVVGRDAEEKILVRDTVDRWAVRVPHLDGQRPPTRLGPGAPTRTRLFFRAAFVTAYSVGLVTFGIVSLFAGALWPVLAFLALTCMVWLPGLRQLGTYWRAWRDLGRVDR